VIDPRFLYQVTMLRAFRRDGEMAMTGAAGQQRVPLSFMREFTFGLPELSEQEVILEFVGRVARKIDQTIEKAKSEIALVMEYRERLIADVVTGKLDVRHIELAAPANEPVADEDCALDEDLTLEDTDELAEVED
jgi:restriction endonuclease S subunit